MPLHDENFNRIDRVWMESELARRLMTCTRNPLDPIRALVLRVSEQISGSFLKAYKEDAEFRKNIHSTVRSGGGVWFGRAQGDGFDSEQGVADWLLGVLVTEPGSYGIEYHLHLHQLFAEFWAYHHGFQDVSAAAVREFHERLKPPEMFVTRGRVPRSPSDDSLKKAALPPHLEKEFALEDPPPVDMNILRKTLARKLRFDVDKRVDGFGRRDWLGIEHPNQRPDKYDQVQVHGSGMQTWRAAGVVAEKTKSDFLLIARDWLEMPIVGAASGSTADMLTTGYFLGGLKDRDRRLYLLGVLAFVIGGGNHSFHEIASIARLEGVPYKPCSYASVIPRSYFSSYDSLKALPVDALDHILPRADLWRHVDLDDTNTCGRLNFGKRSDVSRALAGLLPRPKWATL